MNLTEKFVERTKATAERQVYRDTEVVGFGLRIEPVAVGGRRSSFYNGKIASQVKYKSLGEWPGTTVKEARAEAAGLKVKAAQWKKSGCPKDSDPFGKPEKASSPSRLSPTFEQLCAAYIERHLEDPDKVNNPAKAVKDFKWMIGKYFSEWKQRRVDEITVEDVLAVKDACGKHHYMANRLLDCAKALFSWCGMRRNGKINVWPLPANPAASVESFKEHKRDRFVQPLELVAFEAALNKKTTPVDLRDFIRLAIATGARKSNLLAMRWDEIDLDLADWKVPMSKSGSGYHIALTPVAIRTLEERRGYVAASSPWVFPASSESGCRLNIWKAFKKFLRDNKLPADLRPHDLRRTAGSYLALSGVSLQKIGKALGHKSLASTEIYARLCEESVAEAREAGEVHMHEQMEKARRREQKQLPG
jgi:integrase